MASAESPEVFAKNTIISSLDKLKDFQDNATDSRSISGLIESEFLPKVNQDKAAQVVFSKYWGGFSESQKEASKKYLLKSLLSDYSAMLGSYKQEDEVIFDVLPKTKRKKDMAIVFAKIGTTNIKPTQVAFKLTAYGDSWKIYDVVIMGTSLLKTYKYIIKSKIKRKGLDFVLREI